MKKGLSLLLALGLGILLVAGCQQASETPTTSVPESQVASTIGLAAGVATAVDNAVRTAIGISGFSSLGEVGALGVVSTPEYQSDGWWYSTIDTSTAVATYSADVYFRAWKKEGSTLTEAINPTMLATLTDLNLDQVYIYATYTMSYGGTSFSVNIGSAKTEASCVKYTNILSSPTLSGPISVTTSYGDETYSVSVTFIDATISTSGYPIGTVNFSVVSGGNEVYSGSIVFDGTSTAMVNIAGGGSYEVVLTSF